MMNKKIKSILCGMLFFNHFICAVGITSEPDGGWLDEKRSCTISYLGYDWQKYRYVVTLKSTDGEIKGFIPWRFDKKPDNWYVVHFINADDGKSLDIILESPFPYYLNENAPLIILDADLDEKLESSGQKTPYQNMSDDEPFLPLPG